MNHSEIQKEAVRQRWLKEEQDFPLPFIPADRQFHPYNYECDTQPGYYYIPWITGRVVASKEGGLFSLRYNREQRTSVSPKGYLITALRIGNNYKAFPVHRIVAMLFCEIPERHQDKTFDELEVNHRDGNKTNNHFKNLEWMTTEENMKHAWEVGLVQTKIPVVTLDVRTSEVKRFDGIAECARAFDISSAYLSMHLRSECAGRVEFNHHRFKHDDGESWPDLCTPLGEDSIIGVRHDVVGFNVNTKQLVLFSSLVHACVILKMNINCVRLQRTRKGPDVPYNGWIFRSLSGKPISDKLRGKYDKSLK